MDDFTLSVRQIFHYPLVTSIGPQDRFLVQQGGLGGPYVSATPSVVFSALDGLSIGLHPPPAATGITASFVTTPLGARQGFNWFVDDFGIQRYLQNGVAGQWQMDDGALAFAIFPAGSLGAQVSPAQQLFALGFDGNLSLFQQLRVGRDPVLTNEVATLGFLQRQGVTSFNGRHGDIILTEDDLERALALSPGDDVASQAWVNAAICDALQDWTAITPLVFTFMGRVGDIFLQASDITAALTVSGVYAFANTPPLGAADGRLATTAFVDEGLADLYDQVSTDIDQIVDLSAYAKLASPQFSGIPTAPTAAPGSSTGQLATTAFVQAAVTAGTAGVASWNTRTGAVTLQLADVTAVGGAPLASPALTGTPTAPTAAPATATTQLATTAFVAAAVAAIAAGVTSFNGRTGVVTLITADITGAGGAPIANPALTGTPTAPTAAAATNTTQIATTAFVTAAIAAIGPGVSSFNARTGAVTLQANDVSAVGGALLASPSFTGTPLAPTAVAGTNNTQIATTAFVAAAIAAGVAGVTSFNGRTGAVTLITADVTGAGGAPIASPALTGTPTAPTAAQTDNSTTLATTAYVRAAISGQSLVSSFNTRTGAVTLTSADVSAAGGALLASPTFTGTPAAPTAVAGTATTQLATTAFVTAAVGAAVTSFNGRTGAVTLSSADITGAGGALLASPALTGTPTAPTATAGTNNTQIATTAFVAAIVAASGVTSFNTRTGAVVLTTTDVNNAGALTHGVIAVQTFTASGTYTPTAGMKSCMIEAVGGGAGGGGATAIAGNYNIAGGGGAGAYARKFATAAQIGASQVVTIGGAGVGGAVGAGGGAGGDTSIGTLCIAKGAPTWATWNYAGPGGSVTGTVGDIAAPGAPGRGGSSTTQTSGGPGAGGGGSGPWGAGGLDNEPTTSATGGNSSTGHGGGGAGGSVGATGGAGGGAGTAGMVVITEYA